MGPRGRSSISERASTARGSARAPRLRHLRGRRGRAPDPDSRLRRPLGRARGARRHRLSGRVLRGRRGGRAPRRARRLRSPGRDRPGESSRSQLALLGLAARRRHGARPDPRRHRPRRRRCTTSPTRRSSVVAPSTTPGRRATTATSGRSTGPPHTRVRLVDGDEEIAPGVDAAADAGPLARAPLAHGASLRETGCVVLACDAISREAELATGVNGGAWDDEAARRSAERLLDARSRSRRAPRLRARSRAVERSSSCARRLPVIRLTCHGRAATLSVSPGQPPERRDVSS